MSTTLRWCSSIERIVDSAETIRDNCCRHRLNVLKTESRYESKGKSMGRSIEQENSFLQVLLKLIPSEVIAVYIFVQGVMPGALWPHLVVGVVLVALTPLYLRWASGVRSRAQLALSTCSMVVWIYAMGSGPLRFVRPPYYEPWHGAVLLAVWTLVPPMILAQRSVAPGALTRTAPARAAPARRPSAPAPLSGRTAGRRGSSAASARRRARTSPRRPATHGHSPAASP